MSAAKAIAYLMGSDLSGRGRFYTEAAGFFKARATVVKPPARGDFTLKDVFDDLGTRAAKTPPEIFEWIHIVTHATMFGGVAFALDPPHRRQPYGFPYLNSFLLSHALDSAQDPSSNYLKPLASTAVTPSTTIEIDGCDIGRDLQFLRQFGLMFGQPGRVLASKRILMFFHEGSAHHRRPCRSWSVVMNTPPWPPSTAAKWIPFRKKFVDLAVVKFSAASALQNDPLPTVTMRNTLEPKAAKATTKESGTLPHFMAEEMEAEWEFKPPPPDDAAAVTNLIGGQIRTSVSAGTAVDDTTVPIVVTGRDFVLSGSAFNDGSRNEGRRVKGSLTVVMLAAPMNRDADVSNRDHYAEVTITRPVPSSPGPNPP